MIPITPHLASECISELHKNKVISWPIIDNKYLQNKENNIVVQINGKKRSLISTQNSMEEKDLLEEIKKIKELKKFLKKLL